MANVIKHKRGSGSDPSASNLVIGELAIRTDTGKLFTKMDSGAIAEIAGGGSDIAINTLSSSSGTGGGSATFNGSAYRFTLSAPPSVSAAQLLVSINGVIQKPVTGTGQPSEGFAVDGTDIILGDAPATGSDFFILTFKSLGVSEPADNSVTSAKIVDGAIVNADINASAAIAGSKISPDFGSQNITTSGEIEITGSSTVLKFTENDANPDFGFLGNAGSLRVQDLTNTANLFIFEQNRVRSIKNFDAEAGLDVTGGGLTVNTGTTNTCATFTSTDAGAVINLTDNSARSSIEQNGTDLKIISDTDGGDADSTIKLQVDASTKMLINSSGNVGIGTTSPAANLHLKDGSGNTEIKLQGGASTANDIIAFLNSAGTTKGNITYDTDNDFLLFNVNTAEKMRIKSDGDILLTRPTAGTGTNETLLISANYGSGSDQAIQASNNLRFYTNGANERIRVNTSGQVGINTSDIRSDLHVCTAGSSEEDGTLRVGGSDSSLGLTFTYDQSSHTTSTIYANPTYTNTGSILKIGVDGDANPNQLVLKGDGKVLIGTTDATTVGTVNKNLVVGSTTNNDEVGLTLNVMEGTNGRRVKFFLDDDDGVFGVDSTASTGVAPFVIRMGTTERLRCLTGGGITFNGDTAAANALDDYEEGSWTPAVATGTAGGVGNARYVKIGRVVHVEGGITNLSDRTSSSGIEITGFPFALTFLENAKFTCSLSRVTQQSTGSGAVVDMLHNTSTAFPILQSNSSSTSTAIRHQDLNHNAASIIFSGTYTTN